MVNKKDLISFSMIWKGKNCIKLYHIRLKQHILR